MRSLGVTFAIERLRHYVELAADPKTSEAKNLIDSVKYYVNTYGTWHPYIYATMLLHDELNDASKDLIEFKYLSAEEQADLDKEFGRSAAKLAKVLDRVFADWGGAARLKELAKGKEQSSFFGATTHSIGIESSLAIEIVRSANLADELGFESIADFFDLLLQEP
jgi:hypothetical protein